MDKAEKKPKIGMYGELPVVTIGRFTISMMTDKENENRIWIRDGEEEAGEFPGSLLEPYIEKFFDKYF